MAQTSLRPEPTRQFGVREALLVLAILTLPAPAFAYVGPGAGLSVIGAALAFIASLFLALIGFIWYPLKKLWRAATRRREQPPEQADQQQR